MSGAVSVVKQGWVAHGVDSDAVVRGLRSRSRPRLSRRCRSDGSIGLETSAGTLSSARNDLELMLL